MTQPAAAQPATAELTAAAYLHLCSFQRGDQVTVTGHGVTFAGAVTTPLQDRNSDIGQAWLLVRAAGTRAGTVTVTVTELIDGQWLIASREDADAGRWQPFDPAGYGIFQDPGSPGPGMAQMWLQGRDAGAASYPGQWPPRPAACRTGALYRAYCEAWALAAAPDPDVADLITAIRAAKAGGYEDEA